MKRKILQFERGKLVGREEEVKVSDREGDKKRFYKTLSTALSLGTSIVLPIVGGVLLGRYVDNLFSSAPLATLTLLFVGVVLSFLTILRLTRDIS